MGIWNPWHGCHRYSEGCLHCYIHKGDKKRNIDTNKIMKTASFDAPIAKRKNGTYKMKGNQLVYVCFSSDFLIEEADQWRNECWKMIKERSDITFLFLTKRIRRFMQCIPDDWQNGYDNVIVGCTVENQMRADERLPVFSTLPIKHKNIICQPMLEDIQLAAYLQDIELVVAGGESDQHARPLHYDWILHLRDQCLTHQVHFTFRQCGTYFIKEHRMYQLAVRDLCKQAKKANIDI